MRLPEAIRPTRDRLVPTLGLAALALTAAAYTVAGVGMPMSALDMTAMGGLGGPLEGMAALAMAPPDWTAGYALAVVLMWWIMMIAMMTPSAAPVVLLYDALRARLGRPRAVPVAAFAGGYMATWLGFSLLAALLQWALERKGLVAPSMMVLSGHLLGGAVLVAAGLWQLTPAKQACLRFCRNSAEVLAGRLGGGAGTAFRTGLRHGAWCVGCCWGLMALLFFGGIMNLWWILGLALIVLVEKLWTRGPAFARAVGVLLLLGGGWMLAGAAAA